MSKLKAGDLTGHSNFGIDDAIQNALKNTKDTVRIEVVETRGSQERGGNSQYEVTLATFEEEI